MLTINKVITPRASGKTSKRSKRGYAIPTKYSAFNKYAKRQGGETIERNIQWYRMWYTFLKLALELEQKKIPVNNKLLKVDRKFYKQWDVSEILDTTFDNWWKEHRQLFVLEQVKIVKEIDETNNYIYLKIPTNRNERELLSEMNDLVKGKFKGDKANYPFSNSGINYLNLHVTYNCLVMNINGITGTKILDWINKRYSIHVRSLVEGTTKGKRDEPTTNYFAWEQSVSRALVKGRKTLENVCSSIFP